MSVIYARNDSNKFSQTLSFKAITQWITSRTYTRIEKNGENGTLESLFFAFSSASDLSTVFVF